MNQVKRSDNDSMFSVSDEEAWKQFFYKELRHHYLTLNEPHNIVWPYSAIKMLQLYLLPNSNRNTLCPVEFSSLSFLRTPPSLHNMSCLSILINTDAQKHVQMCTRKWKTQWHLPTVSQGSSLWTQKSVLEGETKHSFIFKHIWHFSTNVRS